MCKKVISWACFHALAARPTRGNGGSTPSETIILFALVEGLNEGHIGLFFGPGLGHFLF